MKMKKVLFLISLSILVAAAFNGAIAENPAPSPLLGIKVSFSTKAYWDGSTGSCMPRPRGWCLHIEIEVLTSVPDGIISGELSNLSTTGFTFSFNRKTGITNETFSRYFTKGKVYVDGQITISEEVAKKLGLPPSYTIAEGTYGYTETRDVVTITFPRKS
jgi:hypothetical protein